MGYRELFNKKEVVRPSVKEILNKYLRRLPLFLVSLIITIAVATLYLRYTVAEFNVSTLILVKNDIKNSGQVTSPSGDLLNTAMNGSSYVNLDNDLMRLKSEGLIERVVLKNNFNIFYYIQGKIRNSEIYLDAPFRLIPLVINDSNAVRLVIFNISSSGFTVSYGTENNLKKISGFWNKPFVVDGKKFMLEPVKIPQGRAGIYIAEWKSISQVAAEVLARFSVVSTSIKSTIIELSLIIENASRGKDLLNAIAMEFKRTNIEELNNSSLSTMRFINERLRMVSTELEGVESNLEKYQGGSKAYGLTQQSSQSFSNSDESSKTMNSILIKKRIVEMIRGSFSANEKNTQVPSTLGIGDPNLSEMVRKYNDLLLRKESESRNIGEKNVILVDIDKQISDLKTSIVDNLQSISKNLDFQVSDVQQQNRSYNSTISELPHKERRLQEIKREQAIKEGLFLYLLQKREEAAISSTSHPSNYEQIDPASSLGPGEPNPTFVFEIAFISAFLMPMLFFYLTDLLSDKVKSREDIIKITDLPIVGEISNLEAKSGELVTLQQPLVGEQFRSLRNNIAFLDEIAANQVILVTSASVGEGKSFISMNLAVIIAAGNKKVAFVDLNFRKDGERNNLTNVSRGITEYLQSIASLSELAKPSAVAPNLYIYSAGSYVKNPGDLLVTKRVQMLFEELKSEYDTVVVNSAPAGLVSDAQALSRYADATLFVIREGSTTKKQVDFIDTLYKTAKIQNICLVLNGVKNGARYGYRGYGRSNRHDVFTKYFIKWQKKKQEQHV